jgi:hypothetical protein
MQTKGGTVPTRTELQRVLRRDWLMLNRTAARNALLATAQAARRAQERAEVERTLQAARQQELSGAV